MPARNNTVLRHIVAAMINTQGNALNIGPWVVDSDKVELDKKSGSFRARQNIDLARMRHHGFKTKAASGLDAFVAATISNALCIRCACRIGTLELRRDIVGINIFAEIDAALPQQTCERCLSGAIRTSDD
jgi:hypothetical protein